MRECCIVIPIYKACPDKSEIASLYQCVKVLKNYPIFFVAHKNLDCSVYNEICTDSGVTFSYKYFAPLYFINVEGYNALMLSKRFYEQFAEYTYMLIYQLDAYVFSDQLKHWCGQQYDYIGAPWLNDGAMCDAPVFPPVSVGNGGFSLRRVEKFIASCSIKIQWRIIMWLIRSVYEYLLKKSRNNNFYLIPCLLLWFPIKIIMKAWFSLVCYNDNDNEDVVFSKIMMKSGCIPDNTIARCFAFEYYPEYLFQLNNEKLPFGCHKWGTYYSYQFWKKYIHIGENSGENE
jgi:hypothetical protein